jgi:toxin FitB
MIVLDTNVVSELMRQEPDEHVLAWTMRQDLDDVYLTAIAEAEIRYGLAARAEGKRRRELEMAAERLLDVEFSGRILPFDSRAAKQFAGVVSKRKSLGLPIELPDAQMAAICLANRAPIATRDVGGFVRTGVGIINPWTD